MERDRFFEFVDEVLVEAGRSAIDRGGAEQAVVDRVDDARFSQPDSLRRPTISETASMARAIHASAGVPLERRT